VRQRERRNGPEGKEGGVKLLQTKEKKNLRMKGGLCISHGKNQKLVHRRPFLQVSNAHSLLHREILRRRRRHTLCLKGRRAVPFSFRRPEETPITIHAIIRQHNNGGEGDLLAEVGETRRASELKSRQRIWGEQVRNVVEVVSLEQTRAGAGEMKESPHKGEERKKKASAPALK